MADNLNTVCISGNLCKDPETRPAGDTVCCNLRIANNYWGGKSKGEQVLFISAAVFGAQGERCDEHLRKGDRITIKGTLTSNEWTTKSGDKRTDIEIRADKVYYDRVASFEKDSDRGGREKVRSARGASSRPKVRGRGERERERPREDAEGMW